MVPGIGYDDGPFSEMVELLSKRAKVFFPAEQTVVYEERGLGMTGRTLVRNLQEYYDSKP